jgi:hypothetical protein
MPNMADANDNNIQGGFVSPNGDTSHVVKTLQDVDDKVSMVGQA